MFVAIFIKGNKLCGFLFASKGNKTLLKWDLLLKERICSKGSEFFPLIGEASQE